MNIKWYLCDFFLWNNQIRSVICLVYWLHFCFLCVFHYGKRIYPLVVVVFVEMSIKINTWSFFCMLKVYLKISCTLLLLSTKSFVVWLFYILVLGGVALFGFWEKCVKPSIMRVHLLISSYKIINHFLISFKVILIMIV